MKNVLILLRSLGASFEVQLKGLEQRSCERSLLPCMRGGQIKKGSIDWHMIIKIIFALIALVLFMTLIVKAQSGTQESTCSGIGEAFKTYIYEPLKISDSTNTC